MTFTVERTFEQIAETLSKEQFPTDFGPKPEFMWLPVEQLHIDDQYQREFEEHRILKIARTFNWKEFGAIQVNRRRDGSHWIFDGQHRKMAAEKVGVPTVPCLVIVDQDAQGEAKLFVDLQSKRKNISPVQKFKAKVFFGDEEACAIESIAVKHGFKISSSGYDPEGRNISAVQSIQRLFKTIGPEGLDVTLGEIRKIWGYGHSVSKGAFIEAVGYFLQRNIDRLTDQHRELLADVSARNLLQRVEGGSGDKTKSVVLAKELSRICKFRGRLPKAEWGDPAF